MKKHSSHILKALSFNKHPGSLGSEILKSIFRIFGGVYNLMHTSKDVGNLVSKEVSHSAVMTKQYWKGSPCIELIKTLYHCLKTWSDIEECQIIKKFKNCKDF